VIKILGNTINEFKKNIETLITKGNIRDAKLLLESYKEHIKNDTDIYSMLGVIYIIEGDLQGAEIILIEGLSIERENFDLNYNLAYLYEIQGRYTEARIAYGLSEAYCKDYNKLLEVKEKIADIEENKEDISVILLGKHDSCSKFIDEFSNEVTIIGYIKNEEKDSGINLKDYVRLNITDIQRIQYDYIVLTDALEEDNNKAYDFLINLGIDRNKIFSILKLNIQIPLEGFNYRLSEFITKNRIELIVTGLSYAEVGINTKFLDKESINFALSSQDLYYDYKILEYILACSSVKDHIKYVLINMAYYSFDFDLSRTFERARVHRYYPFIKDTHNYKDHILIRLLNRKHNTQWSCEEYINIFNLKQNMVADEKCYDKGRKYAIYHSKMDHAEIRKENLLIFDNTLKLLREKNIKPIIIIFPTSEYYYKHYDKKKINEFYKNIKPFKDQYQFLFLDYFDSQLFTMNDFWDDSHLNYSGSKKLTELIQNEIDQKIEKGDDF